ncbi:unnamed protein product [Ostreobium quekettii]|uniref:PWI domain-containing protein n=1 Tax=Ostreobium quekettii TaxID=121088 RepID=A0A8S1IUY7_9CHLO|nr:unnamed protein product [Ostreobium quekettii]|eukprot:evm.model.scf_890.4 EVM.evm.TU.scf_890.4   scf_890:8443-13747(+)
MSGIGGFRGVSASQDARFSNKQAKLMKSMKFPKELEKKVDLKKVNWPVMREWIAKRVTELLGLEDDVLINFLQIRLESEEELSPKELHIELVPFLEKNAGLFMKELWTMLASACEKKSGIPQQILDEKAEEIKRKKGMQDQINEAIRKQREKDVDREDSADRKRERENGLQRQHGDREEQGREQGKDYDRGRGRWGGDGGHGNRDRDWRGSNRQQHRRWSREMHRDRERPRYESQRSGNRYGGRDDWEHDRHRRGRDGGRDRREGVRQEQRREAAKPRADSPAEAYSYSKSEAAQSSPSRSSASGEPRPGRHSPSASPDRKDGHVTTSKAGPHRHTRGPRSQAIKEPASPSRSPVYSGSPASASPGPAARGRRETRRCDTSPSHLQGDIEARGRYQMSYDRGGARGGRFERDGFAGRATHQEGSESPPQQSGRYRSPSPARFDGGPARRRGYGPPRRGGDGYTRNGAGGFPAGAREQASQSPPPAGWDRDHDRSPTGRRGRLEAREELVGSPPRKRVYGGKLALSISPEPRTRGERAESDGDPGSESSKEPKKKHHHKKKDKKEKREKKHRKHKKDKKAKKEKKKRKRTETDSDSDAAEKGSEEKRRRIEDQARNRALASMSSR